MGAVKKNHLLCCTQIWSKPKNAIPQYVLRAIRADQWVIDCCNLCHTSIPSMPWIFTPDWILHSVAIVVLMDFFRLPTTPFTNTKEIARRGNRPWTPHNHWAESASGPGTAGPPLLDRF